LQAAGFNARRSEDIDAQEARVFRLVFVEKASLMKPRKPGYSGYACPLLEVELTLLERLTDGEF